MKKKRKKKIKFKLSFFTVLIFLMDICVVAGLCVINTKNFKTFWIPTAMTTMSHKYLAYTLYDQKTVDKVMSENFIEQNTEKINSLVEKNHDKTSYSEKDLSYFFMPEKKLSKAKEKIYVKKLSDNGYELITLIQGVK